MAESDPTFTTGNEQARQRLVSRLQQLWGSDPRQYWKEFHASGLRAQDIWSDAYEYVEPEKLKTVPKKQPGKASK